MRVAAPAQGSGDIEPVEHEVRDRVITGLVTAVPMLAEARPVVRALLATLRPAAIEGP